MKRANKERIAWIGGLAIALLVSLMTPPPVAADQRGAVRTRSGKQSAARSGHHGHRGRVGIIVRGGYWGGYYPYYPYYWGAWGGYPRYYVNSAHGLGAFDLNVKPKKTEVYVDGMYVGTAGKLDGFPSHLWVERGDHELVFHLEGYETVVRRVTALPGAVVDLSFEMVSGPTVPPEEVATSWGEPAPERRAIPASDLPSYAISDRAPDVVDARAEPGRLIVAITPSDASVYLDGRFLGTGRELAGLHSGLIVDPGAHELEVVRPGFGSQSRDFDVEAGEEIGVEVNLEAEESGSAG